MSNHRNPYGSISCPAQRLTPLHLHTFLLYSIFSIVSAMAYSNYMTLFIAILQIPQIFLLLPINSSTVRFARAAALKSNRPNQNVVAHHQPRFTQSVSIWFTETLKNKLYKTKMHRIPFLLSWLAKISFDILFGIFKIIRTSALDVAQSHIPLPLTLFCRYHLTLYPVDI
ncbi:Uncharacterized protein APZ42_021274 [Daphnia magna]|uniref:Uncharacterized protein n=1 Tax=Daphnia magna TaxID=35525 RepID=A0A164WTI0_9CRUS|nr:Uncharacterized protein APZ42_021274 [Daphnia magna]